MNTWMTMTAVLSLLAVAILVAILYLQGRRLDEMEARVPLPDWPVSGSSQGEVGVL